MNRIATAVVGIGALVGGYLLLTGEVRGADAPVFRVDVNMVTVSFTVTDHRGHYVKGLKPSDFRVFEDGIEQKIASFAEGGGPMVAEDRGKWDIQPGDSSVFILFDTSNHMYATFSGAEDAIADFVRHLEKSRAVALYTFSRTLYRAASLTRDRLEVMRGLRGAVAGDDTALFNSLLLTLRDAAKVPGRKVVVVFSNGPDNASMMAPDDVRRVAEDEGIPIYIVSTRTDHPVSEAAFQRICANTGGQAYFAADWQKQTAAFRAIEEDLANSYTIAYYPLPNPNQQFRKIEVRIATDEGNRYRLRARPGYRPHPAPVTPPTRIGMIRTEAPVHP